MYVGRYSFLFFFKRLFTEEFYYHSMGGFHINKTPRLRTSIENTTRFARWVLCGGQSYHSKFPDVTKNISHNIAPYSLATDACALAFVVIPISQRSTQATQNKYIYICSFSNRM